ncbi:NUDIX domain-containing protein [Actinomycetospora flava]|uniref:NUDIX domain-containing protein n=1 Tax=Actinomycetospora flava TaxID=3129232 RepID=A0ABU8M6Y9_9PSEU
MEVIARAIVVREGAVLLMQELAAGYWFFPGGHVEAGETPEVALVRELREELAAGATVGERLGELSNTWEQHHEINHVFAVILDVEDPVSQEPHLAAGWHRVEDLGAVDVRPRALADLVVSLR